MASDSGQAEGKRDVRRVYTQKSTGELHQPPALPHVFGRCKIDESFLVNMAVKKFLWGQPLYRQHRALKLVGVELNRAMLPEWMIKLAGVYAPVAAAVLFVRDGNLPIDNGEAARRNRTVKIGLKNYLLRASEIGAEAAAIFYTLIGSAVMMGVHPYYYLLDLTKRVHQRGLTAADLIPVNWKRRFYEEAVPEHLRLPQPP